MPDDDRVREGAYIPAAAKLEKAREDGGVSADKQWNEELPGMLAEARADAFEMAVRECEAVDAEYKERAFSKAAVKGDADVAFGARRCIERIAAAATKGEEAMSDDGPQRFTDAELATCTCTPEILAECAFAIGCPLHDNENAPAAASEAMVAWNDFRQGVSHGADRRACAATITDALVRDLATVNATLDGVVRAFYSLTGDTETRDEATLPARIEAWGKAQQAEIARLESNAQEAAKAIRWLRSGGGNYMRDAITSQPAESRIKHVLAFLAAE